MQGKNGLDNRNQQEKNYQNDELFFLGCEKVKKIHTSVIDTFFQSKFERLNFHST